MSDRSEIIEVFGEEVAASVDTPLVVIEGTKGDPGKDGITPTIGPNGNWYLGEEDTGKPSRGAIGAPGKDGVTPHIGDNGNWYLGTTDTGKPSRGATGAKGDPGIAGKDGHSPVVTATKSGKTTTISVDGSAIATVEDGADGKPGAAGQAGASGADGKSAYQYAQDGGYTGTEEAFAGKLSQEPLIGTTNELTPTQVYNAVSAGIPVKVQYTDSTYGIISFTAFNVAESLNGIASQIIAYGNGAYMLCELFGYKSSNAWGFYITTLAQKTDIPSALPNPNSLTIKIGGTTVTYDGSAAKTVTIADGSEVAY